VPFGTGRKVGEIVENDGALSTYHPRVFELLRVTLSALRHAVAVRDVDALLARLTEQLDAGTVGAVSTALEELQVFEALPGMFDASSDPRVRERRFATWFDALRTLRFIHLIEVPAGLPRVPLFEALASAPFCSVWSGESHGESDVNSLRMAAFSAEQALPPDIGAESIILAPVNGP
jgi:hypothetical protein